MEKKIFNISKRNFNIGFDLSAHFIISLEIGFIAYLFYGEAVYFLAALLGGFFIDSDHIFDCFIYFGKISLRKVLVFPYRRAEKVYLLLHSWELIIITGFFVFWQQALFWQVFVFSWAMHLLVDNIDQLKKKRLGHYFFIYRLVNRFESKRLKGFVFD